jgi:hypothetical protein
MSAYRKYNCLGFFPGDSFVAGAGLSKLYLLWTLIVTLILNLVQFLYVVTWPIVYAVGFCITDLVLAFIGFLLSAWFTFQADRDLLNFFEFPADEGVRGRGWSARNRAIRGRYDATIDRGFFGIALIASTFACAIILSYAYGSGSSSAGLTWVGGNVTQEPIAYNHPITSPRWGALSAANLQIVNYRSYIHLEEILRGFAIFFGFLIAAHLAGLLSRQHLLKRGLLFTPRSDVESMQSFVGGRPGVSRA